MSEGTFLYFPMNIHSWGSTRRVHAPMRDFIMTGPEGPEAYVLIAEAGTLHEGLYVRDENRWRFTLPHPKLSEVIIDGGMIDVYLRLQSPVTVGAQAVVYKNGVRVNERVLEGSAVFCVISPAMAPQPAPPSQPGVVLVAGRNISGHRVIKATAGKADYASSLVKGDANKVIGISVGAALTGSNVRVQTEGEMIEPSWNWNVDLPVFNGPDGLLTQSNPSAGYSLIVGVPVSPTTIIVAVKQPIII